MPSVPARFQGFKSSLELSPADRTLLAWLDGLGLPRVAASKPLVLAQLPTRPADAASLPLMGDVLGYSPAVGFLLRAGPKAKVLSHGLWPVVYRTSHKTERLTRKVDPTALALWFGVDRAITVGRFMCAAAPRLGMSALTRKMVRPGRAVEAVLLARVLANRKQEGAAAVLLAHARRLKKGASLAALRRGVGRVLLWEAIAACSNPRISWQELRRRFDRVARGFKRDAVGREALRYRKALDLTIAGAPPPPRTAQELGRELLDLPPSGQERAVRQLRMTDAGGVAWLEHVVRNPPQPMVLGSRGVFDLYVYGVGVVPRLLSLFADPRLTRVRNPRASRRAPQGAVLRVGDVALRVVSAIAGRSFETRSQARAWWRRVKAAGQATALAEMAAEAKSDAPGLLARLLQRDRAQALGIARDVIPRLKAARAAKLLRFLHDQQTPAANALLRSVLWRELRPQVWMAAAKQLVGRPHWEDHLLGAIRARRSVPAGELLAALMRQGNPRAVRGLTKLYSVLKPLERRALVTSADQVLLWQDDEPLRCEVARSVLARAKSGGG